MRGTRQHRHVSTPEPDLWQALQSHALQCADHYRLCHQGDCSSTTPLLFDLLRSLPLSMPGVPLLPPLH